MKRAHVGGPFAEETQGDVRLAAVFGGECDARGDRHVAADDGMAAHEAPRNVEIVHGAAAALGTAVGLAEQFGHGRLHVADARQIMAVVAVRGDDVIRRLDRGHGAHGHGFLPVVQMQKAADLTARIRPRRLFLEAADTHHVAVQRQHQGLVHANSLRRAAECSLRPHNF